MIDDRNTHLDRRAVSLLLPCAVMWGGTTLVVRGSARGRAPASRSPTVRRGRCGLRPRAGHRER